jgi:hypothetical protein
MHAVHRAHAEASKRDDEESTGHHQVIVFPVTEDDPTGERHVEGKPR